MGLLDEHTPISDLSEKSDEELLALSGSNPAVFKVLLERYQSAFMRKALGVVRRREDAEDIVQETFSKIYLYADTFKKKEGAQFSSWGYRILLNTAFTRYQKLKKERERVHQLEPEVYEQLRDTKTEQFEKLELRDYVASIFVEVSDECERVLRKYFIEGKSQQEIADEEGISVGAVKTRVHRAKRSFKEASQSLSL